MDHYFSQLSEQIEPVTFAPAGDPAGRDWIAHLPALLDRMCRRWDLQPDRGAPRNGYSAVVVPVTRRGEPLVLKLAMPAGSIVEETRALTAWNGHGTVKLIEVDTGEGAMLLERLDPEQTLLHLDPIAAAGVAGRLLRRLAIPAPPGFRDVRVLVAESRRAMETRQEQLGSPVPRRWLREALQLARHLERHAGNTLLIHSDLHHDNILKGEREPWLAIDPRAIAGEPELAVPELLWTRNDLAGEQEIRDMLGALVHSGGLDAKRARAWVIVRCVDYWLWGLEHGLTNDPERCRLILQSVMGED